MQNGNPLIVALGGIPRGQIALRVDTDEGRWVLVNENRLPDVRCPHCLEPWSITPSGHGFLSGESAEPIYHDYGPDGLRCFECDFCAGELAILQGS